ncbi:MAG: hypothetical protein H6811_05715 [Phycisphaeraceae bacterium]|nr:hypothetical protein [Phycisphaeraceae bacterium]
MKRALFGVGVLCVAGAAADGQVVNGSFEAGPAPWVFSDVYTPFFPLGIYPGGTVDTFGWGWLNTPTDGVFDVVTGFDGGGPTGSPITVAQDVFIDDITLCFDYRGAWDLTFGGLLDRTFRVDIEPAGGGAALQTDLILTAPAGSTVLDTGALTGLVDVSAFLGSVVRISFEWDIPETFVGPGQFTLDNVKLVPAPGAIGLLAVGGLVATRRRRA